MSLDEKRQRHIGKITNTDQRCVVAFMQIPGREDHALVVPIDSLPERYEQAVMDILESNEGQAEETLANVLHRRLMADTGKSVLTTLHEQNYLVPVPIASVMMYPRPNMPFALAQILEGMGRLVAKSPPIDPATVANAYMGGVEKFNPHAHNAKSNTIEQQAGVARILLLEASDLEAAARQKREQAYRLAPELAPGAESIAGHPDQASLSSLSSLSSSPSSPRPSGQLVLEGIDAVPEVKRKSPAVSRPVARKKAASP